MKQINIHEAKTNLSKLLLTIQKSDEVYVICKNGKPIADLVPHKSKNIIQPHPVMSHFTINYDPTEELTEDEWGEIE